MKQKILGLFMVFVGMLLSASIVHAGQPTIAVTHSIVSESTAPDGTTITTLNMIINNTGVDPLYNVSFEFISSMFPPNNRTLSIGNLLDGASKASTWVMNTPVKSIMPGEPLIINGTATDVSGNNLSFTIVSH